MDYGKAAEVGPFLYEWEFSDIGPPAPAPACGPFLDRSARLQPSARRRMPGNGRITGRRDQALPVTLSATCLAPP